MSETMKAILSWMGVLGIPTIFAMSSYCFKKINTFSKQLKILMKAQQAQMRTQLLELYHKYDNQGWISEEDLLAWDNQYQGYHSLGENGVLDRRRDQLFNLPNSPSN